MTRIKSILSITLLVSILAALGAAGTTFAIRLDLWLSVPAIVALWTGLGRVGIGIYENGSADSVRPSELRMKNPPPPPPRKERGK